MLRLNLDEDDLRDAIEEIVKLNPKRGVHTVIHK
jgi:hypothetical protein